MTASHSDSNFLGTQPEFINRVEESMLAAMENINSEGIAVVNHDHRIAFIRQVLASTNNTTNFATELALAVATDANCLSDATQAGTVVLTAVNVAAQQALVTDAHIDTAVSSQFNSFVPGIIA